MAIILAKLTSPKLPKNGEKQITLMQHFFNISKSNNSENIKEQHKDLCKENWTKVLLHSISNMYDYVFIYLYSQSTHFDKSKMVKWVYVAQKLTKIHGITHGIKSLTIPAIAYFINSLDGQSCGKDRGESVYL